MISVRRGDVPRVREYKTHLMGFPAIRKKFHPPGTTNLRDPERLRGAGGGGVIGVSPAFEGVGGVRASLPHFLSTRGRPAGKPLRRVPRG